VVNAVRTDLSPAEFFVSDTLRDGRRGGPTPPRRLLDAAPAHDLGCGPSESTHDRLRGSMAAARNGGRKRGMAEP
jgi:hypothetical protein